jgi:hypothetical protein
MEQFTAEQTEEQMRAWNEWMGRVGSALLDGGTPFGARSAVSDDGSTGPPSDLNGYSIVEVDNVEVAHALTKDHPFLAKGEGRFTIEIFELVPLPM